MKSNKFSVLFILMGILISPYALGKSPFPPPEFKCGNKICGAKQTCVNKVCVNDKKYQINLKSLGNKGYDTLSKLNECPQGQQKFYLADRDSSGFCGFSGVGASKYCLPHYIYVPSPSGSVNENSEGMFVWGPGSGSIGGKSITGGYVCVKNNKDPVFSIPPPENACPPESVLNSSSSNQLSYQCNSVELNTPITGDCVDGYSKVIDSYYGSGNGDKNYVFICGLGGFKYPWQNNDNFASCEQSGAQVLGGGGSAYACAYTK